MSNELSRLNSCVSLQTQGTTLTIWMDTPDRSVNILNAQMLEGLSAAVEHVEALHERYKIVLFRSRKPNCFFVGADVEAIASIQSTTEADKIIAHGQKLLSRIERLPVPTVAAISGTCLGGGLELALACRYRVASDSNATKLGLPEIKLGLIPGWGGTQRLPQTVSLRTALKMILTGKTLNYEKAHREGLVDFCINTSEWDSTLESSEKLLATVSRRRTKFSWSRWLLEGNPIGRSFVFRAARRQIAGQSKQYPALKEALQVISAGISSTGRSYAAERESFVRLLFSDTGRSLIGLFLSRNKARKSQTWLENSALADAKESDSRIRKVAVIGAGAMGAGIGTLAAQKGYEVVFKEIHDGAAEAGRKRAEAILRKQVDRKRMDIGAFHDAMSRMSFTSNWEDTSDCDLAIEAVLEIETVKREVFEMLDRSLPAGSTMASNTSSLCVTRLAGSTSRRHDVVGLHFFNPVDRMDLVEIVRTESASESTIARALEFVHTLGKTPVITSDKPGFLVNRILFPYLGEAIRMVSEGYDLRQMDREIRRFGMPMGPLELMDQIGIDIVHHVAQSQAELQSDAAIPMDLLSHMVDRGWLGKKSLTGFYRYDDTGKPQLNELIPRDAIAPPVAMVFQDDGLTDIQRRLVYPILNEAIRCLDEMVVTDAWMVDLAMVLGTGFAPHRGGPLHVVDQIGASIVQNNMKHLQEHYGERFQPADGLEFKIRRRESFLGEDSRTLTWEKLDESQHTTHS